EVLGEIAQEEMLAALPDSWRVLPRHVIALSSVKAKLAELGTYDWFTARQNQAAECEAKLLPLIAENPGWRVQYFGLSPIPLAMALGHQIGGFPDIDVYQKLHGPTANWVWRRNEITPSVEFCPVELPSERLTAPGDIVVR